MSNKVILASLFLLVFPRIHFFKWIATPLLAQCLAMTEKGVLDSITLLDSRFLMRNRGFQGAGAGIYLSGWIATPLLAQCLAMTEKGVLDSITLLDSRFLMRNRGFQGAGAGIYLSGNEQARAVESTIYRKKLEFRKDFAWAEVCHSHYHLSACGLLIKL